jgi:hypothetical protein
VARVTKHRCDHCQKEVEDPYLEEGWLAINGSLTRSWGVRKQGNRGDAQTDFIEPNPEYCTVNCMVLALDAQRERRRGPRSRTEIERTAKRESAKDPVLDLIIGEQQVAEDPFPAPPPPPPPPPKPKPWEDPLGDDEPRPTTETKP